MFVSVPFEFPEAIKEEKTTYNEIRRHLLNVFIFNLKGTFKAIWSKNKQLF